MFWIISIALIALALAFILPPLLRQTSVLQDDRREQNISIAKQRLAELEAEFKQGNIEEIAYKASRLELEDALYQDLQDEETHKNTSSGSGLGQKSSAIIMTLLIPILAIGLYSQWGSIEAISESEVTAGDLSAKQQKQLASIDKMVKTLEDKLKSEPNNAKGWFMLGRTYMVMRRHSDAVQAYESANKYKPNDPEILLPLADALATISQGRLTGRPETLIRQALQVDPNDMMGLWLAGMAAEQRNAKLEAVNLWKKLQAMLVAGSEDYKEVTALIVRASGTGTAEPAVTAPLSTIAQTPIPTQAAIPNTVVQAPNSDKAVNKGIRVKVVLSEALKASAKPDDIVFIYAKAVTGPPMPLAAARKQVKDLPLELILDDSMAMMPQMRISAFAEVKVGARVSLTGQPRAQAGDLFTEHSPIKMGESIVLEINQVVPSPTQTTPSTAAQVNIPTQAIPSTAAQVNIPTQAIPSTAAQANIPTQAIPSTTAQANVPIQAPTVTAPSDTVVQAPNSNKGIRVKVILSDALKASVKPDDTVFIYAKAVIGPPMPLAVARKQVKDLPLELILDDSMAMMPQMRISAFAEVKVGARVSLTGQPRAQAGDLFTEYSPIKMGESIVLEINQIVP